METIVKGGKGVRKCERAGWEGKYITEMSGVDGILDGILDGIYSSFSRVSGE